jgi:hypothetical protein
MSLEYMKKKNNWNYDENSPITGNKSVVVVDGMRLCLETGYHLCEWNGGFEEKIPEFVRNSVFVNGTDKWFKLIQFSQNSVLFPTPDNQWEVNTFRARLPEDIYEFEIRRKIPDQDNKLVEEVLDPNNAQYFTSFLEAFDEFQTRVINEN